MSKYTSPDGNASIDTGNSLLSETTYVFPSGYKNQTIETLLQECLLMQMRIEELEDIIATFADPTGWEYTKTYDLIMKCYKNWDERQQRGGNDD